MNTVLTFYTKTMTTQGLWPYVGIWPEHLTDKQYETYIRANEMYLAIQKEISFMELSTARAFWGNYIPCPHPFPSFLFNRI